MHAAHAGARHKAHGAAGEVFIDTVGGALPVSQAVNKRCGPRCTVSARKNAGAGGCEGFGDRDVAAAVQEHAVGVGQNIFFHLLADRGNKR